MSLKKSKQPIMGLAAMLVILYHLLPMPRSHDLPSVILRYILMTAYVGVDIFFFMSGYMAFFSNTDNYFKYIKRKFLRIYPLFIICCILGLAIGNVTVDKLLPTLLGLDLIKSGGGSFLWFIPALMMIYLFLPFYIKLIKRQGRNKALIIVLLIWGLVMILLEKATENHSVNILLCRLPIVFIGSYLAQCEGKISKSKKLCIGIPLLIAGIFLTWEYGFMQRTNYIFTYSFYVLAIPHSLGLVFICDTVFSRFNFKILKYIGNMSLELYCLQMLLGSLLVSNFIRFTGNVNLTFLISFTVILALAQILQISARRIPKLGYKKTC